MATTARAAPPRIFPFVIMPAPATAIALRLAREKDRDSAAGSTAAATLTFTGIDAAEAASADFELEDMAATPKAMAAAFAAARCVGTATFTLSDSQVCIWVRPTARAR